VYRTKATKQTCTALRIETKQLGCTQSFRVAEGKMTALGVADVGGGEATIDRGPRVESEIIGDEGRLYVGTASRAQTWAPRFGCGWARGRLDQ
jgi:hypothetical protein